MVRFINQQKRGNRMKYITIICAVLVVLGISGLNTVPSIERATYQVTIDGIEISYNLYQPPNGTFVPVVVIGHGVNVNKEMMTSFAVELAAHGYVVANVDWRGHGRSTGYLTREGLYTDLEAVIADIPLHAPADTENIALLGYSMGGSPTYTYAVEHSNVKAWVGVGATADGGISDSTHPKNVLMIIAKYDEAFSQGEAKESMVELTGIPLDNIRFEKLYGDISEGTARKIHVVPGADHLTTPWNAEFVKTATSWISETFEGHASDSITFYPRVLLFSVGLAGLMGLLFTFPSILAEKMGITRESGDLVVTDELLSAKTFIGKYYLVTLLLIPTMVLFIPLFLTPLPFTALLTTLTGGLGINLLVYYWLLIRRKSSLKNVVKRNVCQSSRIWIFSIIITTVFVVCYYFLVGQHFLGMIPSRPKIPYLLLYTALLFGSFFFYSLFIQKASLPFFEKKLTFNSKIKFFVTGIVNFVLIYSWFAFVILIPCYLIDNYFFAMILILMAPIFLFLIFLNGYMEKVTGSVIPNTLLSAVWLGFIITTLTPFVSGLSFVGL